MHENSNLHNQYTCIVYKYVIDIWCHHWHITHTVWRPVHLMSTGQLFIHSCIPGAMDKDYNPNQKPVSLCEGCAAGGFRKCQRTSEDQYYSASGAFRCLVESEPPSLNLRILLPFTFLGHLSHSGDLLLWVGVRCRASSVNIFFSRTTEPILNKFGM